MKQVKAHIAVSLDGHTATLDNELDWLPDEVKAIVGKHCLEAGQKAAPRQPHARR